MSDYLHWSREQLYLMLFWPTRFRREVEGVSSQRKLSYSARLSYFIKMLPWITAFAILCDLAGGRVCIAFGVPFSWLPSLLGVILGITAGGMFGLAVRAAASVAGGVAGGLTLGLVAGVAVGTQVHMWLYLGIGVFAGPVLGIVIGLWFRKTKGTRRDIPVSVITAATGTALAVGIFVPIADGQVPITTSVGIAVSASAAVAGGLGAGFWSGAIFGLERGSRFGWTLGTALGVAGALAFAVTGTIEFGWQLGRRLRSPSL